MSTALITGCNRGIGLELARQLVEAGHTVIGACRRSSPELDALGVRVITLDVTVPDSIRAMAEEVEQLDLLINNAGVLHGDALGAIDADDVRVQFEVNAVGPLMITQALRSSIVEGGKVAIITSRMGSMSDNTSGGAYGYRMSKAAVNAAGVSLARDLAPSGIAVGLLHPGWVRTDMTGGRGHLTAAQSAKGLLARIDGLSMETTGRFWHAEGNELPW